MHGTYLKNEVSEVFLNNIQKSSKTLVVVHIVVYIGLNKSAVGTFA